MEEDVRLNLAYRGFCGFELDDAIPDHSTFSKTRTRKWQQSGLFQKAFYEIVKQCIARGLIDGKAPNHSVLIKLSMTWMAVPAAVASFLYLHGKIYSSAFGYFGRAREKCSEQSIRFFAGRSKFDPEIRQNRNNGADSQLQPRCNHEFQNPIKS